MRRGEASPGPLFTGHPQLFLSQSQGYPYSRLAAPDMAQSLVERALAAGLEPVTHPTLPSGYAGVHLVKNGRYQGRFSGQGRPKAACCARSA